MFKQRKQAGLTLIEITATVAIIAIMVALTVPAVRGFMRSFASENTVRMMVNAALSSARSMAMSSGHSVGVRFQVLCRGSLLEAPQYMVFVEQDAVATGLDSGGLRSMDGQTPVKLPEAFVVLDLIRVKQRRLNDPDDVDEVNLRGTTAADTHIDDSHEFRDMSTFTVLFSRSGRMVIQGVRVRNKQGYADTKSNGLISFDDVFNKKAQVDEGRSMFYQDDYWGVLDNGYGDLGLGPEPSRGSFLIVDREPFKQAYVNHAAWSEYLQNKIGQLLFVSPYAGTLISAP